MKKMKWLYWTPRILAILFTIFISLFALDVFTEGYSLLETLVALFMHLIPTYVLIIVTVIAWKKERIGGTIFILLGIFYIILFWSKFNTSAYLLISGSVILIGMLFLLNSFK